MERTITYRLHGKPAVQRTYNTANRHGRDMARNLVRKLIPLASAGELESFSDEGPCGPGCIKMAQRRITHSMCPGVKS